MDGSICVVIDYEFVGRVQRLADEEDFMAQSAIILKTPEMKVQLGRTALGREFDAMPGG